MSKYRDMLFQKKCQEDADYCLSFFRTMLPDICRDATSKSSLKDMGRTELSKLLSALDNIAGRKTTHLNHSRHTAANALMWHIMEKLLSMDRVDRGLLDKVKELSKEEFPKFEDHSDDPVELICILHHMVEYAKNTELKDSVRQLIDDMENQLL